jgi:predicted transposase/invertase (TIGR01784 family)
MPLDNPHDKFFKAAFSRKDVMAALIESRFPEPLRKRLDVTTLELTNGSYIDEKLNEHFADLVYDCAYAGDKKIQVALLIEHKSYQEEYPHLQLLRYLLNAWNEDKQQNRKLIPVLPIVIYHGKGRWKYASLRYSFEDIDEVLHEFIPEFRYLLYDVSAWPDEEILAFKNQFLALASFLLKHSRTKKFLQTFSSTIQQLLASLSNPNERNFIESVFVYIFNMEDDLTGEEVLAIFRQISPQTEEIVMSAYERTVEEINFETVKNLIKEGLVTDLERLRKALKLSEKKMEEFLKRIELEK